MRIGLLIGWVLVALVGGKAWAAGARYQVPLDESAWSVESSIFACTLSHEIPYYGKGVFAHLAGESANFQLLSSTPRLETGKASLMAKAPSWKGGKTQRDLGYVPVRRGKQPVQLDAKLAEQMLSQLYAGNEIEFTRAPWYGAEASSKVLLSNVNFQLAYTQYLDCLADLLPVNFEQIRRTAIYFPVGADYPQSKELQKIDNIAIYVKADKSVQAFFVDGHTDSRGNREENLDLSKRRAEWVVEQLVQRGVPKEKITTRWHGERYPVASNRTQAGRDENRRVTIRLEKEIPEASLSKQAAAKPKNENT